MAKIISLVGQQYGRLTVLEQAPNLRGRTAWKCACACGNTTVVTGNDLRRGNTTSCGCYLKQRIHETRFKDLTGMRFGRLTVIERAPTRVMANSTATMWKCQCDCGQFITVEASHLMTGATLSCGCLRRDVLHERKITPHSKHGGAHTRLYLVWRNMRSRTSDPKNPQYKNYGARGITVCDEWQHSFAAFKDWAMANGYDPNAKRGDCTIDRIDNDGNYTPDNCRWADLKVQRNNQRPRPKKECTNGNHNDSTARGHQHQ